jgi:phosphoribosylanthranilate isomerase
MNKVAIKICGLTDVDTATIATDYGAHFIGLVFHPPSKRCINVNVGKQIAAAVKKHHGIPVAVFYNHDAAFMQSICDALDIDHIQLHGPIAKNEHHLLSEHYKRIYALQVTGNGAIDMDHSQGLMQCNPARDYILFDNVTPGAGIPFTWHGFQYAGPFRFGIAGGLNALNVKAAISQLQPTFVDISTGVENAIGIKDRSMIRHFIATVKQSDEDDQ